MTVKDFSFPLNVYARLLEMQEGRVEYLHFPTYESADEPVLQAQERASRHLWQALPPPCRLLEVGIGLGTTLSRLSAAGYRAMGITPEAAQVAEVRRRHGPLVEVMESRLEDFSHEAGQWDALLFQESAQYIDPLALFDAAERLLHGGRAHLVVMDEFALRRGDESHAGLHELGAFCDLALRFGWRLAERTDLSEQAAPTIDYLLRGMRARRADLMTDLSLSDEVMDGLVAALMRSQALYRDGVHGYALLRFERDAAPQDRLVRVSAPHAPAMRELFASVFGHAMSESHWAWKYDGGRGCAVALMRGSQMVAHYGGMTRQVVFQGRAVMACQVCDVMVAPQARSALARKGAMHKVAATFLDTQIGWGRPHWQGYGFPNRRAFGAARHLGLYEAVDAVDRLSWPAAVTPESKGLRIDRFGLTNGHLDESQRLWIDEQWRRMAKDLRDAAVGVRDAQWLQFRYLARPGMSYELWAVRSGLLRRPVGLLVVRRHDQHLEVLDLLGPVAAFGRLVAVARLLAHRGGLTRIECWISRSHRRLLDDVDPDHVTVTDLGVDVPANVHTAGADAAQLRNRWFLMAGDADFT